MVTLDGDFLLFFNCFFSKKGPGDFWIFSLKSLRDLKKPLILAGHYGDLMQPIRVHPIHHVGELACMGRARKKILTKILAAHRG